jgi:hypothetical protein
MSISQACTRLKLLLSNITLTRIIEGTVAIRAKRRPVPARVSSKLSKSASHNSNLDTPLQPLKGFSTDTTGRPQGRPARRSHPDRPDSGAHGIEHAALHIPDFSDRNDSLKDLDLAVASTIKQALALTNCAKAWTTRRIGAASLRRDSKVGPPVSTSQESISRHPISTAYLERAFSISAPNTTVKIETTGGEAPQSKINNVYHNTVKEYGDPHTLILLLKISHAWTSTTHLKASAQAKAATSLQQLGIHRERQGKSPISVRIQESFFFEPRSPTSNKNSASSNLKPALEWVLVVIEH